MFSSLITSRQQKLQLARKALIVLGLGSKFIVDKWLIHDQLAFDRLNIDQGTARNN